MSEKNFLNFHVLISHSPSCLNRDDMNMQKTAIFGGTRRVRVSSQSLKRAIRTSDYYCANFDKPTDRTKALGRLANKYVKALASDFPEETVRTVVSLISGEKDIQSDTQGGAVAVWSVAEVKKYCEQFQKALQEGQKSTEIEKVFEREFKKGFKGFNDAFRNSVDLALSGRMATSGIMTSVDAALAVAHAITTHTVDGDIDWFTAVDDLVQEEGDTGSAHLDTQEFCSGVFYRYASLNIRQLQENLGGISRGEALVIAKHTLHMLATVVPSAKQNSFAAFNVADMAMAAFSHQPISLANAFEEPVKAINGSGFLSPSIQVFAEYKDTVYKGYGLNDRVGYFSLKPCEMAGAAKESLAELESWVEKDGLE